MFAIAHLARGTKVRAETGGAVPACQMAVLSARWQLTPAEAGDNRRPSLPDVHNIAGGPLAYCETDVEATDPETVIQDLLDGQFSNPVRGL